MRYIFEYKDIKGRTHRRLLNCGDRLSAKVSAGNFIKLDKEMRNNTQPLGLKVYELVEIHIGV